MCPAVVLGERMPRIGMKTIVVSSYGVYFTDTALTCGHGTYSCTSRWYGCRPAVWYKVPVPSSTGRILVVLPVYWLYSSTGTFTGAGTC